VSFFFIVFDTPQKSRWSNLVGFLLRVEDLLFRVEMENRGPSSSCRDPASSPHWDVPLSIVFGKGTQMSNVEHHVNSYSSSHDEDTLTSRHDERGYHDITGLLSWLTKRMWSFRYSTFRVSNLHFVNTLLFFEFIFFFKTRIKPDFLVHPGDFVQEPTPAGFLGMWVLVYVYGLVSLMTLK
jgi:hypothetical protein